MSVTPLATTSQPPLIRTFEGDILSSVKSGDLSQIKLVSKEMDANNIVYGAADSIDNNRKILVFASIAFLFILLGAGAAYYYFYIYKKPAPAVVKIEEKKYYAADVWKNAPSNIQDNTDIATSTENYILLKVTNFDNLYNYILNNENIFISLAKNKFEYNNLEKFTDFEIDNQNIRIADGETGPFLYGFVGKNYLLITSSVQGWINKSKELR